MGARYRVGDERVSVPVPVPAEELEDGKIKSWCAGPSRSCRLGLGDNQEKGSAAASATSWHCSSLLSLHKLA